MGFFIGICVASFYLTRTKLVEAFKNNVDSGLSAYASALAGSANSVFIAITNKAYKIVASKLIKLENHKYENDYQASFITKMFIF